MWSVVAAAAKPQPTPIAALAVAGMNDVLNRQGYTQAAWWNRIPIAAWGLMGAIAICCNVLIGMPAGEVKTRMPLLVLPVVLAIAFMLLADLDSPRGGIIRVTSAEPAQPAGFAAVIVSGNDLAAPERM